MIDFPRFLLFTTAAHHSRMPHAHRLHPRLYAAGAGKAFRDILQGNNGAYKAKPGWDACTGLGSPDGERLRQQL
jgi:hypothetical protein